MGSAPLNSRLQLLLSKQNPDGGWGHYAGQTSWLEPTIYGAFALWGEQRAAADRALALVRRWQRPDGAFRPCLAIDEPHWATSLALMAMQSEARGAGQSSPSKDEAQARAAMWLLGIKGAEGGWLNSLLKRFVTMPAEQNEELHGWPWRPGTSSWIEPTAHALVALKRAGVAAQGRIVMGEQMILERRCEDLGWNYGNRRVYGVAVPSYPETTALALLGLQGRREAGASRERARRFWNGGPRGMGRAWLGIAMQSHGWMPGVDFDEALPLGGDLTLTALEAVALQPAAVRRHFSISLTGSSTSSLTGSSTTSPAGSSTSWMTDSLAGGRP